MKIKIKVIDSLWVFFVAVAFVGPFALPILWRNPNYSKKTKVAGSVFIILVTLFLFWVVEVKLKDYLDRMQEARQLVE